MKTKKKPISKKAKKQPARKAARPIKKTALKAKRQAPKPLPILAFNQFVTLRSDKTYRGYVYGQSPDGKLIHCTTKAQGKQKRAGNLAFKKADVIPCKETEAA